MNNSHLDIEKIIALFHKDKAISYELKEIRIQENDVRYILYVNFPNEKFVIKLAYNNFTTDERINGWVTLIEKYKNMGCYSPSFKKSINNNYVEKFIFKENHMIVWEEEYAIYYFPNEIKNKERNLSGNRYIYQDELIKFYGNVGERHLCGFSGNSGWARLEPFVKEDLIDEVTECVNTFDKIIKSNAPHFINKWKEILEIYNQNKEKLKEIYSKLPKSVFQADWGESNVLVDKQGHFQGLIDYNLSGEDTVLNIFMSLSLYGGIGNIEKIENSQNNILLLNENRQNLRIENMLDIFREFKKQYKFSEIEVEAAPLLYKYIIVIEYETIEILKQNLNNYSKLKLLFDFMKHELLRDDINFRKSMLN